MHLAGYRSRRAHATLGRVYADERARPSRAIACRTPRELAPQAADPTDSRKLGIEAKKSQKPSVLPALASLGVDEPAALAQRIECCAAEPTGERRWQRMVREVLSEPLPFTRIPFAVHRLCFAAAYQDRDPDLPPAPAWLPEMAPGDSNVRRLAQLVGAADVSDLHRWSIEHRTAFWELMCEQLRIGFRGSPGPVWRDGRWYPEARLNIAENCLRAGQDDDRLAIIYRDREDGPLDGVSRADLARMAHAVAGHCRERGLQPGARVALYLPMTVEAVAAYLGIILAGCTAVSIADSFAAPQVAIRMRITGASLAIVATPTYERLLAAAPDLDAIVIGELPNGRRPRAADTPWARVTSAPPADAVSGPAAAHSNILFSSGTTGEPKAIPWTHLTPIKCATDALLLHDVRPDDVLAWPTSLGWMMGPWLIYAALLNRATIALYYPGPKGADFGRFVRDAGVTMLGLIPTLVRIWRRSRCMEGIDWSVIRRFSSTGECSDPDDQLYLMALAGYRPVIEYCGGTEIGGGYISATMDQPSAPATFTTPAFGLDLAIRDERGRPAASGELFLVPPSVGLSTELLNQDHDDVYLDGTPLADEGPLRRHGDHMQRLPGGYYRALGRVDDTMNLSGIKVSSAEIERALSGVHDISECAAVAVADRHGGPDRLVVFAVPTRPIPDPLPALQRALAKRLNPLFKISEVRLIDSLPRTASNKVMRRELRAVYAAEH